MRTLPAGPGVACGLHRYHSPEVTTYDEHHIIPLSMDGPDEDSNLMVVCPTGHRNVHVCIAQMNRGTARQSDWGPTTWALATQAFDGR